MDGQFEGGVMCGRARERGAGDWAGAMFAWELHAPSLAKCARVGAIRRAAGTIARPAVGRVRRTRVAVAPRQAARSRAAQVAAVVSVASASADAAGAH